MHNQSFLCEDLNDLSKDIFHKVISLSADSEMTTVAPLGASGDSFLLHGEMTMPGRKSVVSIRSYNGDPQLLITDKNGRFLFYGRFHVCMGVEFLTEYYWMIFSSLKHLIRESVEDREIIFSNNAANTIGFDMLISHLGNLNISRP